MTLRRFTFRQFISRPLHCPDRITCFLLAVTLGAATIAVGQAKPDAAPDVLVLSNGDTLHGKFVSAIQDKVNFHSEALGDLSLGWDKIRELHTGEKFAVLGKNVKPGRRRNAGAIPTGAMEVANQQLTLKPESGIETTIPVKDAAYIMDSATLDKHVNHQPGLLAGWNGAATAGATLVTATENQYTFSGGIGLVRAVPTVAWLDRRDRTAIDFTGSFGKITQPGYDATPGNPATFVPGITTKSAIYHADAERDEYFSPRVYVLGQTAFDHNFGQKLDLQQIYGGGLGWTVLKKPHQEGDLKGTMQYEKQQFITAGSNGNQNLVGSTFSASYVLHTKRVTYTQGLAYIPAYNNLHAYSANETDTVAFPAYKNLSFSIGTLDSYLNDPPAQTPPLTAPPTKRNSFQFTMGLTYAIKAKE